MSSSYVFLFAEAKRGSGWPMQEVAQLTVWKGRANVFQNGVAKAS